MDLDLLAVGLKKQSTIMQNDYNMGNINSNEMGTISDLNKAMHVEEFSHQKLQGII
jgi:hypothetical protein